MLLLLAGVYGYHVLILLFGTAHCLSIVCGETDSVREVG